jgi:hypothetical protein
MSAMAVSWHTIPRTFNGNPLWIEEIAEFLAGLMFDNKHLDTNEGGYEFTFLFNGEENNGEWDSAVLRSEIEEKATALYNLKEIDFQRKDAESKKRSADNVGQEANGGIVSIQ